MARSAPPLLARRVPEPQLKAADDLAYFRQLAATTYPPGHEKHRGTLMVIKRLEQILGYIRDLAGLDLSPEAPVSGWSVVAALRGEA